MHIQKINEENKRKILKFLRLSKNRNTINPNLQDAVEAVIRGKVKCLYQKRRKIPNIFYNSEFLESKK